MRTERVPSASQRRSPGEARTRPAGILSLAVVGTLAVLAAAPPALALTRKQAKCLGAIARETRKFAAKSLAAIAKCREKQGTAAACPDSTATRKINAAEAKKKKRIKRACKGFDPAAPPLEYRGCPGIGSCPDGQCPAGLCPEDTKTGFEDFLACIDCAARALAGQAARAQAPAACGNGKLDAGEGCEPGTIESCPFGASCRSDCTCPPAGCGNGAVEPGEECDPPGDTTQCQFGACQEDCTCPPAPKCAISGGLKIVTKSTEGSLNVGGLAQFPFPAGVITTVIAGPPDEKCHHEARVPVGGFSVPTFCIVGLGFSSDVIPSGCTEGQADGSGVLIDAGGTSDLDTIKVGDTSASPCGSFGAACDDFGIKRCSTTGSQACTDDTDCPSGEICVSIGQQGRCSVSSSTGCNTDGDCPSGETCVLGPGAGSDNAGDVDLTVGNSKADAAGTNILLHIPGKSITWLSFTGCPDPDGVFTPGTDVLITEFDFILSPTTATARAKFTDKNSDGCSFAGSGPAEATGLCSEPASAFCSQPPDRLGDSCTSNGDCDSPPGQGNGVCSQPRAGAFCASDADCDSPPGQGNGVCSPLAGSPAPGPGCVLGQATTQVAMGPGFSGGGPLFDLLFASVTPATVTECGPEEQLPTCTLPDGCLQ